MKKKNPKVAILMGSDSDLDTMRETVSVLEKFGVGYDIKVLSAHRTPDLVVKYVRSARARGIQVLIGAAGGAAHLAGTIAANTTLPVIGVPIETSSLSGLDSLLSTVQMPSGIPVATVAIGKGGASNAGYLAIQILAASDASMVRKLEEHKRALVKKVIEKNVSLASKLKSK